MLNSKTLIVGLGATALVLAACTDSAFVDGVNGGDGMETGAHEIYGGTAPTANYQRATVALHGLVRRRGNTSVYVSPFCSGVLIREDIVLTAAHCYDAYRSFAVYVGDDPAVDILDHLYEVEAKQKHAGYSGGSLINDIAIVKLKTPVTEQAPVANMPASESFVIGETLTFSGFGVTETGTSGQLLTVTLPLGGLGCSVVGCPSPGDDATQISYLQGAAGSEEGPCSGDSGGPAFISRGGTQYAAGLTSYGDAACTQYGVSTRVDAYEAWIDAFIATPDGGGGGGGKGKKPKK